MKKESPLLNKSFDLSVLIVTLCRKVNLDKKEFVLSKQLIRSGTSPGAMIREAQKAESKADFIHKLKIAEKEAAETQYWLELMFKTEIISIEDFTPVNNLTTEVSKMLSSAIVTLKKK